MTAREIIVGSDQYIQECLLRDEILRTPLGLSLFDEDLEKEKGDFHFGLFLPDGHLGACLIVVPLSPTDVRIRQMAVASIHQGKGMGRRIMTEVEDILRKRGMTKVVIHARASVVGFYEKLGYTVVGEEFMEVSISHRMMEKIIRTDNR